MSAREQKSNLEFLEEWCGNNQRDGVYAEIRTALALEHIAEAIKGLAWELRHQRQQNEKT